MDLSLSEMNQIDNWWNSGEFDKLINLFENKRWTDGTQDLTLEKKLAFQLLFYTNIFYGNGLEVWKVLHRYGSYVFSEIYIDLCKSKFPELYNKALPIPSNIKFKQSPYNENLYAHGFKEITDLYNKIDTCNQNLELVHNYIKELIYDIQINSNADSLFKIAYLQADRLEQYTQALNILENAIIINPNKALYWGYYDVFGMNIDISPELGLYYINKAITIDPDTLLWRLLKIANLDLYFRQKMHTYEFSLIKTGLIKAIINEFNYITSKINITYSNLYESYVTIYQSLLALLGDEAKLYLNFKPLSHQNDTLNFPLYTKIAGVTYNNRQEYLSNCNRGDKLTLVRFPNNPYDRNAIGIFYNNLQLGFIKKELAEKLAPYMDQGQNITCTIVEITGGNGYLYGANIKIDI